MVLKKYQVPGTVPSGKPPKSEPYRTAPCRTMQWKSATRLSSGKDHWNTYNLTLMELEQTTGSSGQRGTTSPPPPPPQTEPDFSQGFFSILSPMEFWFLAAVASGLLSWGNFTFDIHIIQSNSFDLAMYLLFLII